MPVIARRPILRNALAAAGIALAAVHLPAAATTDLTAVVDTCPVGGRDPSSALRMHHCGVWSPDDFAAVPSWNTLQLLFKDPTPNGGGVVATLKCMRRSTGVVSTVATVRSVHSPTVTTRSVRLPAPLNFKNCGYFVQIEVDGTTLTPKALMVVLRTA
ncbi:MAG: hypothetical protein KIT35_12610 [Piscinibacter sp.]|uniref:hypothetical protein n=1 Tax=Piscinibacter TaxID=1114981 RepID=UPI000FDD8208|nr:MULTISPECIES: hypothetical protein [Piscinibacter]MCW5664670.1 hypothetical protein [Piscinibacter sp.]